MDEGEASDLKCKRGNPQKMGAGMDYPAEI